MLDEVDSKGLGSPNGGYGYCDRVNIYQTEFGGEEVDEVQPGQQSRTWVVRSVACVRVFVHLGAILGWRDGAQREVSGNRNKFAKDEVHKGQQL